MSLVFRCVVLFAGSVESNFLVVLLESGDIFASLGEFALFHAFADIPVDEGSLGVHQVEFVVESGPGLGNGGGVGEHANGTLNLREIAVGNSCGWLIVDADLEASGTPVNELNRTLSLDAADSLINLLGNYVATMRLEKKRYRLERK